MALKMKVTQGGTLYYIPLSQNSAVNYIDGASTDDQHITGRLVVDSHDDGKGLYVSRSGSTTKEFARHSLSDGQYIIRYTNDEAVAGVNFQLENTDTESGDGTNANSGEILFNQSKSGTTITINGSKVLTEADGGGGGRINATTLAGLSEDKFLRSDQNDTTTGDLAISKSSPRLTLINNSSTNSYNAGINFQNTAAQNLQLFHEIQDSSILGSINGQILKIYSTNKAAPNAGLEVEGEIYSQKGKVWHAGNDGKGSGLDAGLLEGEEGSYYLDWSNTTNKPLEAMSKADFQALQEERKRNNAGSGFKEWGSHEITKPYENINEGLWYNPNATSILEMGGDTAGGVIEGVSRTLSPLAIVNGIQHKIQYTNIANRKYNAIKFPSAPNGTKTYDSSTGVVTQHATSNEAFGGVIKNGDFRNGTTGWGGLSVRGISSGKVVLTTSTYSSLVQPSVLETGKEYKWEVVVSDLGTNPSPSFNVFHGTTGENTQIDVDSIGNYSGTFTSVGTDQYIGSSSIGLALSRFSVMPVTESVITSRQDLCFLETWQEKIADKDIVCPLGNVQYGATTWNGITLSKLTDLGVGQGYSAFGEWDTDTVGYGARWSTLSDVDKKKFLADPENNIYYDPETDELIQCRYRIRVREGEGNDSSELLHGHYQSNYYPQVNNRSIMQQGKFESIMSYGSANAFMYDPTGAYVATEGQDVGMWFGHKSGATQSSYNRQISAIPICLVQRMNQGAYSPVHNPEGCARYAIGGVGYFDWFSSNVDWVHSKSDCFIPYPANNKGCAQGNIGSTKGRNDQYKFYDAIYAGQVKDLRLDCNIKDVNELREDAMRKAVAGETRGWGKVPFTHITYHEYPTGVVAKGLDLDLSVQSNYDGMADNIKVYIEDSVGANTYTEIKSKVTNWSPNTPVTNSPNRHSSLNFSDTFSRPAGRIRVIISYTTLSQYNSLPWTDIIGSPENIQKVFPNGVVGQWIPYVTLEDTLPLNRKCIKFKSRIRTTDNGITWSNSNQILDTVANTSNVAGRGSNNVELNQYESLSNFTEPSVNSKIVGSVGSVYSGQGSKIEAGNRLIPSLSSSINKGSQYANNFTNLENIALDRHTGKLGTWAGYQRHMPIKFEGTTNSLKTLYTIIKKDGLLYMQYHYKELKYKDGYTPWGDDYSINIVNNESITKDTNGLTVKIGCHHEQMPIGIA